MTALCGGGTSQARPLTDPIIHLTAAGIDAFLAELGYGSLGPVFAIATAGLEIVTAITCATDPPPDPGLVAQDVIDAMNVLVPSVSIPAQLKLRDWFVHRYWWDICQCSSGSTPAPPVMSNPGTSVGTNTGAPSGTSPIDCWSGYGAVHFQNSVLPGAVAVDPWLPASGSSLVPSLPGQNGPVCRLPPTMTGFTWDLQNTGGSKPSLLYFVPINSTGTSTSLPPIANSSDSTTWKGSSSWTPTTATPYANFGTTSNPSSPNPYTTDWVGTVTIQCSNSPPGTIQQPCCPPDPLIDLKLTQIYGLVLKIFSSAGGPAGSYVKGTRHAGLTGSGNIAVSNRNGVLVDVTTAPPTFVQGGNPPYIWDLGWLSCSTPDGFIDEKRLTRTLQIWLPGLFPISTSFGYFLNPGVVADITELLPV